MESQEVVVIIGAVSTLVVAVAGTFLKYLSSITKADRSERIETAKANAEAQKLNAKALTLLSQTLQDNSASNKEIAEATKQSATEAKERNGHLAELQLKSQEMIDRNLEVYKANTNDLCDKIKEVSKQHIKRQEVDIQTVKVKE